MAVTPSDKALLAAAALLAVGSIAAFSWQGWQVATAPDNPVPRVELATTPNEPAAAEAPAIKVENWTAPGAQKRGREWIYDAFTPPEIFYSARTRQFTVKPPSSLLDEEALEGFGLELISVRPEPYRLQLFGFGGEPGNWRGMFQNIATGEVFLGSSGLAVPKLNLTIKSLEVAPQAVGLAESMTTRQLVATAVVVDAKTGREVILTHRERHYTGTVFAFVAAPGETASREVRQGDQFKIGEAVYRIEKIQTNPASIEVVKESPNLSQPDRRVMLPRELETAETSDAPPAGTNP